MISKELKKIIDPNNKCCCEYHLAHKCKEWAWFKNNYNIASFVDIEGYVCAVRHNFPMTKDIEFYADTESEAIFKACQWILDSKGK